MELRKILERVDAVPVSQQAQITQLKHEEDGESYQVWRIDTGNVRYILKEAKGNEAQFYRYAFAGGEENVPALYQVVTFDEKTYLLMEYIEGKNLCKCDRKKLMHALDALVLLQRKSWETCADGYLDDSFEESLLCRQNRGRYLNDPLLEEAYEKFLSVYRAVPKTLCHDDLLPFNVIVSEQKAYLIDWESAGFLPYPTSFARLIAHTEDHADAFFYMTKADRSFAIDYYYNNLLKEKGISYADWLSTLEYFLFYEYCEWVYVGNRYNATDGEYYKKYLPIAQNQAAKILQMKNG